MPKLIYDDVFHLIKSLSRSEKRYFRIFVSRHHHGMSSKFIHLFELIDKQKTYNEQLIIKKSRNLKPSQLANLKAYLYQYLLQSLQLYNRSSNIDIQITNLLDHARILYNKCLYKECIRMIDKAKKLAMENDRSTLLLEILELERLLANQTVAAKNEKRVNNIVHETEMVADRIKNINAFSNLTIKLNSMYVKMGFIRNPRDKEKVKAFLMMNMPKYDENRLSFHEKLYLYHSYTNYHFFIQDFRKGYQYAKKSQLLFEKHPEMVYTKLEMYIKTLNNLLVAQNKLLKYTEFIDTFKKLISLKRINKKYLTENINLNLFKTIYIHEINRHFMLGEFMEGTKIVNKLSQELNNFIPRLDKHYILIFYYKIACLYFGAGNYKVALDWLNKIINSREVDLRVDIHSFARILSLISHYEIGDEELLSYQIKSTYRFLLKRGNLQRYQKIILGFLKNLSKILPDTDMQSEFIRLKEQLMPLTKNPYEKRAFIYFDIITWLESKIEKKTVQEIIQTKVRKIIREWNAV